MSAEPAPAGELSTDPCLVGGPARNLRSASAPDFEWHIEGVSGAEGRELRAFQAAATKELIKWLRESQQRSTRAG